MAKTKGTGLKGIDDVMDALNKAVKQIEGDITKGLIECSIVVMRDMEKTAPKIPVDTGNLRASRFVTTAKGNSMGNVSFKGEDGSKMASEHADTVSELQGKVVASKQPIAFLGFSANYAMWVHEMVDADFTKPKKVGNKLHARRPGAGAKFFEMALIRNKGQMLQILAKYAKIK